MVSIPPSRLSSTLQHVEEFLDALVGPLLDRCRVGHPALGLAYYEGEQLDPRWQIALEEWGRDRGLYVEHLRLGDLGDSPISKILAREQVGEHLFSIEVEADDLPDAALDRPTPIADINIHRDTLRDKNICLLLWIPRARARRFLDLASNLADYRSVDIDVPSYLEDELASIDEDQIQLSATGTKHNLPIPSLGENFVGREVEMEKLHAMLRSSGRGAITDALALEGLGGIGKTRLAIEYAWRYLDEYNHVYFLRADSREVIRAGIAELAGNKLLDLPETYESEEEIRFRAVLSWFSEHENWLLILDNADSESSADYIADVVLRHLHRGHVLLTTRFRRWGSDVRALSLASLAEGDAVQFLIASTEGKRRATPDDKDAAIALAKSVDGLPLALEQIAAWVRVRYGALAEALAAIQSTDDSLLRWYDPKELNYPRSVAAIWERATERLNQAELFLLRFLAWLAPSPAPDFLIRAASEVWPEYYGPAPEFVAVAGYLADYSLVTARSDRAFQLHRLWQELERRRTPQSERMDWDVCVAEVLSKVTPDRAQDVRAWPRLALLYPHGIELFRRTEYGERGWDFDGPAAGLAQPLSRLLNQFGGYARERAEFGTAEPMFRRALAIDEKTYGSDHPVVGVRLNNLAGLLFDTNRLAEAEELYRRALEIAQKTYGPNDTAMATRLNNLAGLLHKTNRLADAEPLYRRALAIDEQSHGVDHPRVARDLNNLAELLRDTNRLQEAEPLYRRALAIDEKNFGPDHPEVAGVVSNLALLLWQTDRRQESELLMRKALAIDEKNYGPDHPNVALRVNNLAGMLQDLGRLDEAEPLCRRALAIDEKAFGSNHPRVAIRLNNLAGLLQDTGRLAEAEQLYRRALETFERSSGHAHPDVAAALTNLGTLLTYIDRFEASEVLLRRAVEILFAFKKSTGHMNPYTQIAVNNYTSLLERMGVAKDERNKRVVEIGHRVGLDAASFESLV